MFRQVCTIESSFFKATSGIHKRLLEGRHLVLMYFRFWRFFLRETLPIWINWDFELFPKVGEKKNFG